MSFSRHFGLASRAIRLKNPKKGSSASIMSASSARLSLWYFAGAKPDIVRKRDASSSVFPSPASCSIRFVAFSETKPLALSKNDRFMRIHLREVVSAFSAFRRGMGGCRRAFSGPAEERRSCRVCLSGSFRVHYMVPGLLSQKYAGKRLNSRN